MFPLDNEVAITSIKKAQNKGRGKKLAVALFILVAILAIGGGISYVLYEHYKIPDYSSDDSGEEIIVKIPKGATASAVATILVQEDVIKSEKAFINAALLSDKTLSYGAYKIRKHISGQNAFDTLINPDNAAVIKFTIPEGHTAKQTADIIQKNTDFTKDELRKGLDDPTLLPEGFDTLEGWLFPATYEFDYDATIQTIYNAMIDKTQSILDKYKVDTSNYRDILTVASIAQEEVVELEDMSKVTRVIDNRLDIDMELGMDTIVGYGVTDGEGGAGLELNQSDLDDETAPYNVRIHHGLPPTPISNPGEEAIAAAVSPAEGDWLYFVTVNPKTGETKFLETEAQFYKAQAEYKEWLYNNG